MRFERFLLDRWIERKFSGECKIHRDFTASSGPSWKLRELLDLDGGEAADRLLDLPVTYPSAESLAELAIRCRDAIFARAQTVSRTNLQVIEAGWPREDDTVRWIRPDGGFTVFPWFPGIVDTRPLCERLGARGLLVVPEDCFGIPEHIRVGFGSQREGFGEAFDALRTEVRVYLRQERQGSTATVPSPR